MDEICDCEIYQTCEKCRGTEREIRVTLVMRIRSAIANTKNKVIIALLLECIEALENKETHGR